jgi:hypothetical protein
MLGNAQVTDTTRNIFALAGRIEYLDSISKVTMTRKPAVISETQNKDESIDTVYLGAEKLIYHTLPRCDVDSLVALDAEKRVEAMHVDPVGEYRKKAAAEAAAAEEEAKRAALEEKERAKKERSGVGRGLLGTLVGAAATSFIRSVSTSLAKSITGGTKSSGKTILGKAAQSATTTATRQIVNKTLKSILK